MNLRHFSHKVSSSLILGILLGTAASANAAPPSFSLDPASPSIIGNITPDDVLMPGPAVFIPGTNLGLQDDFFSGIFDNLESLSYGKDPIQRPLFFSVDRVAVGLPGTAVNAQAQPGTEDAAGDVFTTLPPFGSNQLFVDEEEWGLQPGFLGDDLDGLELDTLPSPFVYFSIDSLSATNGLGGLADDILISSRNGVFGTFAAGSTFGIDDTDDLDALVLWDKINPGILDPGIDMALFSLSTFSTSTFTFSGTSYNPGVKGFLSPADILFTDFTGDFSLFASAPGIGLLPDDNVDALDTIIVPEPSSVAGLFLVLGLGVLSNRQKRQKPREYLSRKY